MKHVETWSRIKVFSHYLIKIQICKQIYSKIYQMMLVMVKNTLNQKPDTTLKSQLLEMLL